MPKAPLKAQIAIGLFAVLAFVYALSAIRLDEGSNGTRFAVPGQLITVRMDSTWDSLTTSDASVVAPVSVTLSPRTAGYFVALKPGRATLKAVGRPCPGCLAKSRFMIVEISVFPSG